MVQLAGKWLTRLGNWLAHPGAFGAFIVFVALWLIFDGQSFDFAAIATIITLCMTLFIQRSEHRDTQALHAKMDELLRTHGEARSELTHLDEEEPEDIVEHRNKSRRWDEPA